MYLILIFRTKKPYHYVKIHFDNFSFYKNYNNISFSEITSLTK